MGQDDQTAPKCSFEKLHEISLIFESGTFWFEVTEKIF
jgi:hypothetical protein